MEFLGDLHVETAIFGNLHQPAFFPPTQLGAALHFVDVSFRYAPTPQAKSKIGRHHQYWQNRLPASFASEVITELSIANAHIPVLRQHRNRHELHRQLQMTAHAAWDLGVANSAPRCAP